MQARNWLQSYMNAYHRSRSTNPATREAGEADFDRLCDMLPSGAGFDSGTKIVETRAGASEMLIMRTSFHHMNDVGYYVGWTHHVVRVRPCLDGSINVSVSGRNRNDIKDYIAEMFYSILTGPDHFPTAKESTPCAQ